VGTAGQCAGAAPAARQAAVVLVLDAELSAADEAELADIDGALVLLASAPPLGLRNAELILPVTTMVEENGVYVNRDGRAQRFQQAKVPPGMARPAWWIAGEVLAGPGPDADAPATADEAFAMLGNLWPVFAGMTHASLGYTGQVLASPTPRLAGATP
jgi:NADH-quinone oxidoreductase subunit G